MVTAALHLVPELPQEPPKHSVYLNISKEMTWCDGGHFLLCASIHRLSLVSPDDRALADVRVGAKRSLKS